MDHKQSYHIRYHLHQPSSLNDYFSPTQPCLVSPNSKLRQHYPTHLMLCLTFTERKSTPKLTKLKVRFKKNSENIKKTLNIDLQQYICFIV